MAWSDQSQASRVLPWTKTMGFSPARGLGVGGVVLVASPAAVGAVRVERQVTVVGAVDVALGPPEAGEGVSLNVVVVRRGGPGRRQRAAGGRRPQELSSVEAGDRIAHGVTRSVACKSSYSRPVKRHPG